MLKGLFARYNFFIFYFIFYVLSGLKAEETNSEQNFDDVLTATVYMDAIVAGMHFVEDLISSDNKKMVSDRVLSFSVKGSGSNFYQNETQLETQTSYKGVALEYRLADIGGLKIDQSAGYYQVSQNNKQGDKETGLILGFNSYYVTKEEYLLNLRYYAKTNLAGTFIQVKRKGFNQEGGIGLYKLSTLASHISGETGFMYSDERRFFKTGIYYQKIHFSIEDIQNDIVKLESTPFSGHIFGYEIYDEMMFFQKGDFSSSVNLGLELNHTAFNEVGFVGSYYTADQKLSFTPSLGKLNDTRYLLRAGLSFLVKGFLLEGYYLYSDDIQSSVTKAGDRYHFVTGKISYDF